MLDPGNTAHGPYGPLLLACVNIDDREFGLQAARHGFTGAKARFQEHGEDADEASAFVTLCEALWWAISVDDAFWDLDGTPYTTCRGGDPDGAVMGAARFPRNRSGHQQAIVAVGGREGLVSFIWMMSQHVFRWRDADEIPAPPAKYRGNGYQAQRAAFVKHLQGQKVTDSLDAIERWFTQWENLRH